MSSIVDQIDALEPGVIRVFRDSEHDIGFREALLLLDGVKVGNVDYKHVFEVTVKPGQHTLQSFNRVLYSKIVEFEVKPGERITFQVANVGGMFFKFFMVMLCMGVPKMRLVQEKAQEGKSAKHTVRRASR